jgi:hypothetical protein
MLEQGMRIGTVLRVDHDAATPGHIGLILADLVVAPNATEQAFYDPTDPRRLTVILDHDDELIAPEASDGVTAAQHGAHRIGDLAEQEVSVLMTEGVIDRFEIIDIDERQRDT